MRTPLPLPEDVLELVGTVTRWVEDRTTIQGLDTVRTQHEDDGLILGARWARDVDGKPFGEELGLVQLLMERPDGTTRWTQAVYS